MKESEVSGLANRECGVESLPSAIWFRVGVSRGLRCLPFLIITMHITRPFYNRS